MKSGLLPLTPYEPPDPGRPARGAGTPGGQLSLDALLGDIPAQRTAARPNADLHRRQLHRVLTALLEVHTGHRPVAQVDGWLTPALRLALRDRVRVRRPRLALRRVHPCRPADDSLEVAATASAGPRVCAVAARFELDAGSWRCTTFTVLEPGTPDSA
ncbi:Rv3235 family protein [Prauserella oleivorans]|uniref:Rv3235 family protein n=1 Tax=Prauserella oleivorans TaxID=1478153 RepID=A0ABW5WFH5_9PSEU